MEAIKNSQYLQSKEAMKGREVVELNLLISFMSRIKGNVLKKMTSSRFGPISDRILVWNQQ